ncbi:hypothetical protein BDQ12DRAFT_682734 [Crucibulum laeve]|uniref:intramembrane prenyl-peptidase Rce1 n=1 Tax=Crucibulum laeve TaxID=68775 RepID=A0A5C3M416_9AGAR|nr:hypothetical protein BDQ12DRAFT_682734 [Crucibulum laeve]
MPLVFPAPILSTTSSHLLAFFFSFSYVGSLYISKNARLSFSRSPKPSSNGIPREKLANERWRDDPDVIRARLAAVTIASLICCAAVLGVLWHHLGDGQWQNFDTALNATIVRLGLLPDIHPDALYPHLVTPVLFLGPLYAQYLSATLPFQKRWSFMQSFVNKFFTWQGIRNYSWAPLTEEIVFRACVLAVYHLSGASVSRMIFLGPLSFGLAHVHHAWDTFNRYGRTASAAKRAIISSIFQLAYTTLFGFHCSYLFLRTGSIYPAITAHIFCNIMGLPEIAYELRKFPKQKKEIFSAYILGIIGFIYTLPRWTKTPGVLYWDNSKNASY